MCSSYYSLSCKNSALGFWRWPPKKSISRNEYFASTSLGQVACSGPFKLYFPGYGNSSREVTHLDSTFTCSHVMTIRFADESTFCHDMLQHFSRNKRGTGYFFRLVHSAQKERIIIKYHLYHTHVLLFNLVLFLFLCVHRFL